MEKLKVDVLIKGDLICKQILTGGGEIYPCKIEKLNEWFDYDSALVIDGDIVVDNFNSMDYTVVVTGALAAKGGSHGSL